MNQRPASAAPRRAEVPRSPSESYETAPEPRKEAPAKAKYHRPVFTEYGSLLSLVLGPSPGIGESGNPAVFRVGP